VIHVELTAKCTVHSFLRHCIWLVPFCCAWLAVHPHSLDESHQQILAMAKAQSVVPKVHASQLAVLAVTQFNNAPLFLLYAALVFGVCSDLFLDKVSDHLCVTFNSRTRPFSKFSFDLYTGCNSSRQLPCHNYFLVELETPDI